MWYGYDGTDNEIFFYDGVSTTQLTNNSLNDWYPQVSGNRVVWRAHDGNDWEIFLWDEGEIIQLTDNEYADYETKIDGDTVVWYGHDGNDFEIFIAVPGPEPLVVSAALNRDWVYQNTPVVTQDRHMAILTISVDDDPNGNTQYETLVSKLSGPGDVTCTPTADPMVWQIVGSRREEGATGEVTLEVLVSGVDVGGEASTSVSLTVRLLGDVDDNGGVEPGDVTPLVMKLNGNPPGGYDDAAFDLDCNGGAEPNDVSILLNILNGQPVP